MDKKIEDLKMLFDEEAVKKRTKELAVQINESFGQVEDLTVICVLKGSSIFCCDLIKQLKMPVDALKLVEQTKAKFEGKSPEVIDRFLRIKNNNAPRFVKRFNIESMDKDYIVDSLGKLKEVIKRLPKDEMKKIVSAMVNEFSEHPDQFIAYVQSGKILGFYKTEGFKKAVMAAGVSWTAVNIALIYTIESILADLKLKSGRLGVMKALDSLEDPAYYANIEPETASAAQPANLPANNPKSLFDMLKK